MSLDISRMLDGDLQAGEVERVLTELVADPARRDHYTIYGLVGDVLRGNSTPDDGFSMRIFERMRTERAAIEPGYDPLAE